MKENCPECKNLPEGEVIKGHDHRIKRPKHEDEIKEFAKDHFEFTQGLKSHFKQLPRMSGEAKRALIRNLCQAHSFTFLEGPNLYVCIGKLERLKALIEQRKEVKND